MDCAKECFCALVNTNRSMSSLWAHRNHMSSPGWSMVMKGGPW